MMLNMCCGGELPRLPVVFGCPALDLLHIQASSFFRSSKQLGMPAVAMRHNWKSASKELSKTWQLKRSYMFKRIHLNYSPCVQFELTRLTTDKLWLVTGLVLWILIEFSGHHFRKVKNLRFRSSNFGRNNSQSKIYFPIALKQRVCVLAFKVSWEYTDRALRNTFS